MSYTSNPPVLVLRRSMSDSPRPLKLPMPENCQFKPTAPNAAAFVICLGQFPLELAAPRLMLLSLGALCIAWDRDDAA